MSRAAQKLISASGGKAYEIEQSLLVSHADTTKLRRTPSSAGNRKTFTFSTWCKRAHPATGSGGEPFDALFGAYNPGTSTDSEYFFLGFNSSDLLTIGAWTTNWRHSSRKFRDTAAWYHIVLQADTTQSTADNRFKLYVNGVQETSFSTTNNPSQDLDLAVNAAFPQAISDVAYDAGTGPYHFSGYMAETHLFDGATVAPSEFGETDSVTGQWIPKKYTGTASYGTNGYYMKYVSGAIGTDSSGQGNNYTTTNLANTDVVIDSPTNNFCTLNPLRNDITLTQGNLQAGGTYTSTTNKVYSTFGLTSGKWWVQVHQSAANVYEANGVVNISQSAENFAVNSSTNNVSVMNWGTDVLTNGSQTQTGLTAIGGNNVLGIALDLDNGTVQFYINGSTIGSATSLTRNTGDVFVFCQAAQSSGYSATILEQWNFGQNGTHCGQKTAGGNADGNGIGDFLNAPPSGFLAPCTSNLATPAVKKSTEHFDTKLYAGNGATAQEISLNFNPDLVWVKSRTDSEHHSLVDRVRGDVAVNSNQNIVEYAVANFDWNTNNTVDVPVYGTAYSMNTSGDNYVMYHWKAGGSGSSNTDGSINTTATSVNTTAGFSISNYQGTGSNATVGHGLGVAPSVIIIKNRDTDDNWRVYSRNDATDYLALNWDGGSTDDNTSWNDTAPTSSVFSIGTDTNTNRSGDDFIAYCFAEVEGFSKFGTYEGNNSTDGPFVNTGFTPAWVLFKYVDGSGEWWWLLDNKRSWVQPNTLVFYPNASNAESAIGGSGAIDFLSNGFKIRATNGGINGNTTSYFYMAFAEFPFKYANANF